MNNATPLRLVDWKPRLVDYLSRSVGTPFAYGQFDCFLFTLGAVAVMTGVDLTLDYRGRYTTCARALLWPASAVCAITSLWSCGILTKSPPPLPRSGTLPWSRGLTVLRLGWSRANISLRCCQVAWPWSR